MLNVKTAFSIAIFPLFIAACTTTDDGTTENASAAVQPLSFSFDWGDIPLCTTGNPNTVTNPTFRFRNMPDGVSRINFRMRDLDVPSYNHGGGRAAYSGGNVVAPGAFTYRSPCPPSGSHTYEWTATARDASGQVVARGTSRRQYP